MNPIAPINPADSAWVFFSVALVFLMTPGLAFFYGGMVRSRHVVSTMYQTFIASGVVGIIWAIIGYSLAYSGDVKGLFGTMDYFLLNNVDGNPLPGQTVPHMAFMLLQCMYAIITPSLITGAFAERIAFRAWLIIMTLWSIFVYAPVCHWVWGEGGWIRDLGGVDFAGGLVVHTVAGVSALICAITFGRRSDFGQQAKIVPYDTPLVLLGTSLLWFGWFGFNGGAALAANSVAAHAMATTFFSAAAGLLGWTVVDWGRDGKPSALGSAIGTVVGLVAITPAAGYVEVPAALVIGSLSGALSNYAAEFAKLKLKLDDTLDVFACHGVGGIIGAILTGVFTTKDVNPNGYDGLLYGETRVLAANLVGVFAVSIYACVMTYVILKLTNYMTPVRVSQEEEEQGLDQTQHNEKVSRAIGQMGSSAKKI
jgi:Amt family ammonium transporter